MGKFTTIYFAYVLQGSVDILLSTNIEFAFKLKTTVGNRHQILIEATAAQKGQIKAFYSNPFRETQK